MSSAISSMTETLIANPTVIEVAEGPLPRDPEPLAQRKKETPTQAKGSGTPISI